jgi:hypothetical protein
MKIRLYFHLPKHFKNISRHFTGPHTWFHYSPRVDFTLASLPALRKKKAAAEPASCQYNYKTMDTTLLWALIIFNRAARNIPRNSSLFVTRVLSVPFDAERRDAQQRRLERPLSKSVSPPSRPVWFQFLHHDVATAACPPAFCWPLAHAAMHRLAASSYEHARTAVPQQTVDVNT